MTDLTTHKGYEFQIEIAIAKVSNVVMIETAGGDVCGFCLANCVRRFAAL